MGDREPLIWSQHEGGTCGGCDSEIAVFATTRGNDGKILG